MGTLLTIAATLLVVAVIGAIFFWFVYHTFHGDLPGMLISAVVAVIVIAIIFGILGFTFPALTAVLFI
jgi:hypothetical protein